MKIINPYIFGGGGGGSPTPDTIGTVILWYDASDASTLFSDTAWSTSINADDTVGSILDKSGNGYHGTRTLSTARPHYRSGGYLEGDESTNDSLISGTIGTTYSQPWTIVYGTYVGGTSTVVGNNKAFSQSPGGSFGTRSGDWQLNCGSNLRRGTPSFPSYNVVVGICNGTSSEIYVNWALQGTAGDAGTGALSASATSAVYWQAQSNGTDRMYFLLIFDGALSSGQLADLKTWVNNTHSDLYVA